MCTAKKLLLIRITIWLITFVALGWFLYMGVVPFGKVQYDYDFSKSSGFISKLSPTERVEEKRNGSQKIIGNPVYFSLYTPRTFDTAKIILEYENRDARLLEVGVLADKTVWRYDLKPVMNATLDQIALVWDTIREGNLVLFQKNKQYGTISDFLSHPPEMGKIAVYNYDWNTSYKIADYKNGEKPAANIPPLQGSYQFYAYVQDENLSFDFTFQDQNQNKDADNIDIFLYYKNKLIGNWNLPDDGNVADDGKAGSEQMKNLSVPGLPEGAYKIEIKANDDIVTEKISTSQSKLSFIGKLKIYVSGGDIKVFTDSKKIGVLTAEAGSLQKITAGKNEYDINETYKQFQFSLEKASSSDDYVEIGLKAGGLLISGDGIFSFGKEAMLNPEFKRADNNLDAKTDGVEYVIARYQSPEQEPGFQKSEIVFDLKGRYRENGKYSFIISAPELSLEDQSGKAVTLKKISVSLEGRSLKDKVKEKISGLFKK